MLTWQREGEGLKLHGTMVINEWEHLQIGGCDTVKLAHDFGTPLYVMDEDEIRRVCRAYKSAFADAAGTEVIYASKAFMNLAICKIMEQEGLGMDIVSAGELYTAIRAEFPAARLYFHGNNKQADELKMALEYRVGRIVADNFRELDLLNYLAGQLKQRPKVLLRLSPGVEAHTHEYIQTGQIDSKFGFTVPNGQALEAVKHCLQLPNLQFKGIHCHIGSQIFEMDSYRHAAKVMMEAARDIKEQTGAAVEELNLGGGFGIYYAEGDRPATIAEYAEAIVGTVRQSAAAFGLPVPRIMVEPGRSIVGEAGTTLYTVGSIKDIPGVRKYVAVDGGMTDNPRPALYQAVYEAVIANQAKEPPAEKVTVTGRCCESGDMLIWDINLPKVEIGDILAVFCTGAYNYSMSMNYNRLPRPAAVLVKDGQADIILERETCEDLLRNDRIPQRLM